MQRTASGQSRSADAGIDFDCKWGCSYACISASQQSVVMRFGAGAAAMLELLSEPLYILAAVQLRFRLRALVDTAAIIAKSAAAVALLQLTAVPAALALSWAQLAFAAVTLACYGAAYAQDMQSWLSSAGGRSKASGRQKGGDSCRTSVPDPADTAMAGSASSTVRQRKSNVRQTDSSTEARQGGETADTSTHGGLLHVPTLWLCGSFSLQVVLH